MRRIAQNIKRCWIRRVSAAEDHLPVALANVQRITVLQQIILAFDPYRTRATHVNNAHFAPLRKIIRSQLLAPLQL